MSYRPYRPAYQGPVSYSPPGMSNAQSIAALQAVLPQLSAKDAGFAQSLLNQYNDNQGWAGNKALSDKQWFWVGKLATQAAAPAAATKSVGDFTGVVALFEIAARNLKFPKIRLQLASGYPVVLSLAGASSRKPGTVNVTNGGPFGSNTWYGRVDPASGVWEPSSKVDAATIDEVAALLTKLADDPAGVARSYGSLTGSCCFCAKDLTDPRSVKMGYGPTCADHYGLPWGE